MDEITKELINQLDDAIEAYHSYCRQKPIAGSTEFEMHQQVIVYTKLSDLVLRFAPQRSAYRESAKAVMASIDTQLQNPYPLPRNLLTKLEGIVEALREAYNKGYIKTVEEMVNSELFSDFLEMGSYYLTEGHKDAAAVILGGVLEEHLRKLCQKNEITLTYQNIRGETKNKMGNQLNQDLVTSGVYNELQRKQIGSWMDIRNAAAHGHYSDYSKEQVRNMLDGMQTFFIAFSA